MAKYKNVSGVTHFQDDKRCVIRFKKGKPKGIDCHGVVARSGEIDSVRTTSGCGAEYVFRSKLRDCTLTPSNKVLYCDPQ